MPEMNKHMGLVATVLVSIIGVLGLVATYATSGGVTGAAYEVTDTRVYIPFAETFCPDPDMPVPVFEEPLSRVGNTNKVFVGCIGEGESIPQTGGRFRPSRNRNKEATSAYADHFTRRGNVGMIYKEDY